MVAQAPAITSELQPAETYTHKDRGELPPYTFLMSVKGWRQGWVEAGRTGGKAGVCGRWLQLIPDGNWTVQLF